MSARHEIHADVNGAPRAGWVDSRRSLADFLREDLGLTGTHVGCEQGVCGACTVLVNGRSVRSCLMLAIQADGCSVETVEALVGRDGSLHPIQEAFSDCHGLQCGFCTPGLLMRTKEFLADNSSPSVADVRAAIGGNLCRCTGYQSIVESILEAARRLDAAEEAVE